jgi:hypothetical protein
VSRLRRTGGVAPAAALRRPSGRPPARMTTRGAPQCVLLRSMALTRVLPGQPGHRQSDRHAFLHRRHRPRASTARHRRSVPTFGQQLDGIAWRLLGDQLPDGVRTPLGGVQDDRPRPRPPAPSDSSAAWTAGRSRANQPSHRAAPRPADNKPDTPRPRDEETTSPRSTPDVAGMTGTARPVRRPASQSGRPCHNNVRSCR